MKVDKMMFKAVAVAGVVAVMVVGCSTPTIPITMNVAGEVKLSGVNKIALADFNSLPGDTFSDTMAADGETCALVKRVVASAFYASPMYQIVDMDVEKRIHDQENVNPKKRFDAIVYGRVWWQITPETSGQYPQKYTLETWRNIPYTRKNFLTGKSEQAIAHVTTLEKDVIKMLDYRVRNATLMLTLSVYRLGMDGEMEKLTDTYQVSNQGFTLMNGILKADYQSVGVKNDNAVARLQSTGDNAKTTTAYEDMFEPRALTFGDLGKATVSLFSGFAERDSDLGESPSEEDSEESSDRMVRMKDRKMGRRVDPRMEHGREPKKAKKAKSDRKVDANGKLILTQKTVSMPTELQAKLMLAASVSKTLSAKLAPTKTTFNVPAELGDVRLENLLRNGAFRSAKDYSLYTLRQKMGKQICEKMVPFLPEFGEAVSYPVPDSTEKIESSDEKALAEYLADEDLDVYLYALGICSEATQNLDEASEYYRFAFNVKPTFDYALGISRVYMAMGESARLRETKKAKKRN